jgi:hypothetical protein
MSSRSIRIEEFREWPLDGLDSIAVQFRPTDSRCGIYILTFDRGARYVGQSQDVVSRLATHRRRWPDVSSVAFKPFPKEELDAAERAVLAAVEAQGHPVRNRNLAGKPGGEAVLDLVITREAQLEWLHSPIAEPRDSPRHLEAVKGSAGREAVDPLMNRPDSDRLIGAAASYVSGALPWASQTEGRFWTVTSLPSTGRRNDWQRLICISAQNVEVLVIGELLTKSGPTIAGFLNLDPTAWVLRSWLRRNKVDASMEPSSYGPIGNIASIHFTDLATLEGLLRNDSPVLGHARELGLNLMRKGPSMFSKYHNLAIADEIFRRLAETSVAP